MLIVPSPDQLGDKRLSSKEQLLKSFEQTDKGLQRYRLDDHDELKKAEERMGQQMAHNELVRRVCKLNPNIWAEDSLSDANVVGLYTTHKGQKKYLVAFDKGYLPEFSIILTDAADLAIKEKRGWRTVLTRLLKQDALTWEQVMSVFGDAHGKQSKRWYQNTKRYRG